MKSVVIFVAYVKQGFRRNAANIQTRSSKSRVFLNAYRLQTQLSCLDWRHITARASSNDT